MILKILLIISIVAQLVAALIAIRLTRVTKYNFSWVLITVALTLMSLMRVGEFLQFFMGKELTLPSELFVWVGVVTSLCFAVGVFLIRKILTYINKMEQKRRLIDARILNTIIRTEEKERMRFSKEIHDGMGPLLSSAKMSLSALTQMNFTSEQKEIVENTNLVVDEAIKALKEISNNLSPHVLNNFGLVRAIRNFIRKLDGISATKLLFTTNLKMQRFDSKVEVILYRVVCEMINNGLKHAKAMQIELNLQLKGDELQLLYRDNGVGFAPKKVMDTGEGMGLSNLVSRIESLKGAIQIDSTPGNGTMITIKVNLKVNGGEA